MVFDQRMPSKAGVILATKSGCNSLTVTTAQTMKRDAGLNPRQDRSSTLKLAAECLQVSNKALGKRTGGKMLTQEGAQRATDETEAQTVSLQKRQSREEMNG